MQVAKNKVVSIDYKLTDNEGQVLDTSEGRGPLAYLHGTGGIIPGLEKELDGKQTGDEFQVSVDPSGAYGDRDEALQQQIPREKFEGVDDLQPGMQFQVNSQNGPMVITVTDVADQVVTVDGNHPLAGVELNFDVKVREVREATPEEVAHGHAHGPGGASH